ncbi:unnamed protein product [Prunus armeniaca]
MSCIDYWFKPSVFSVKINLQIKPTLAKRFQLSTSNYECGFKLNSFAWNRFCECSSGMLLFSPFVVEQNYGLIVWINLIVRIERHGLEMSCIDYWFKPSVFSVKINLQIKPTLAKRFQLSTSNYECGFKLNSFAWNRFCECSSGMLLFSPFVVEQNYGLIVWINLIV